MRHRTICVTVARLWCDGLRATSVCGQIIRETERLLFVVTSRYPVAHATEKLAAEAL